MDFKLDNKRGTGRTTRMLMAAVTAAAVDKSKRVWIVAHDRKSAENLNHNLKTMFQPSMLHRIEMTYVGANGVARRNGTITVLGVEQENVYVDHHVYYVELQRLSALFEGFHKYD